MNYKLSFSGRINNRGLGKPNEDLIRVDPRHDLFLVLDGITRVHAEYDGSDRSAACEVNRIFSERILAQSGRLETLATPEALAEALREMVLDANRALIPYRETRPLSQWQYYPGTVGILAALWEDRLYCLWAGDCIGLHLRDGVRRVIAVQQTVRAKALGFDKARLYAEVCNHPEHPCAYGIFNGDSQVDTLLGSSWTELRPGDVVLLSTDGMAPYLLDAPVPELTGKSPEALLDASAPYDAPPHASYADDKAILRLEFF